MKRTTRRDALKSLMVGGAAAAAGPVVAAPAAEAPAKMTAVPYYLWNNRGPGRMMVWIPES